MNYMRKQKIESIRKHVVLQNLSITYRDEKNGFQLVVNKKLRTQRTLMPIMFTHSKRYRYTWLHDFVGSINV